MSSIGSFTPSYDANGDVLNDNAHTYAWDAEGRPTSITSATVTYDALSRQVEQDNAGTYTQTVYDPMGNRFANMDTIKTLNTAPVLLPAGAQAVYVGGLDYYKHADWEGSARFFSTPTQTMWGDVAYGPYGEIYGPNSGTYTFTGQIQEHNYSNLYRFMYREYGTQGRWPSPDPAGIASANPANPQSWNRYAYVLNNPLLFVDPAGLHWEKACVGGTNCSWVWYDDPFPGGIPSTGNPQGGPGLGGAPSGGGNGPGSGDGLIPPPTVRMIQNVANCDSVLPDGQTVGDVVQQEEAQLQTVYNTIANTPYPENVLPTLSGYFFSMASPHGPLDFKNNFRDQAGAQFLGDAGNFAFYAIGSGFFPISELDAGASAYAIWSHGSLSSPSAQRVRGSALAANGCQ